MTITSVGYPGQISDESWASITADLGTSYSVRGPSDFRVIATPGGTRQVTVLTGGSTAEGDNRPGASGAGVHDWNDQNVTTTPAAAVSAGSRYDLVVLRRQWPLKASKIHVIEGTSTRALPARNTEPGELDDQPLALVRWDQGKTDPVEIIDLRVWQGDGGAVAVDELALTYLDRRVGSRVRIGSDDWLLTPNLDGSPSWSRSSVASLPLFGAGPALSGNPLLAKRIDYKLQAGTTVNVTDAAGYARITFPTEFPNGLLTILLTDGDTSVDRATGEILHFGVSGLPWGTGDGNNVVYAVMRPRASWQALNTGGLRHRVNWIAIGW